LLVNVREFTFLKGGGYSFSKLRGIVAGLQAITRSHKEFASEVVLQASAIYVDEQMILEKRHLERSRNELRREVTVNLSIQAEKNSHAVVQEFSLDYVSGFLNRSGFDFPLKD